MEYKIIKNFLDLDTFRYIQEKTMGSDPAGMAYFFNRTIAYRDTKSKQYYFTHSLYQNDQPRSDYFSTILVPLAKKLNAKTLIRAKVNLYPSTDKIVEHDPHRDFPYSHKGCVFSINTCDGYTKLGDKKIPSIENQALLFDSSIEHSSTSCTNDQARFNININYF